MDKIKIKCPCCDKEFYIKIDFQNIEVYTELCDEELQSFLITNNIELG